MKMYAEMNILNIFKTSMQFETIILGDYNSHEFEYWINEYA